MSAIEKPESRLPSRERPAWSQITLRTEAVCLIFLSFVGAVFLLRYAQAILLPFVLSLLIFYALDPIVTWVSKIGVPRFISAFFVMMLLIGAVVTSAYMLRGQASDLLNRLPEALTKARNSIENLKGDGQGAVARVQQAAGELEKTASAAAGAQPARGVTRVQIEEPLFRGSDFLLSGSMSLAWLVGQAITVFFLIFFLLASGDLYKRKLIEVVGPTLSRQKLTVQILNEINFQIGRFLLVQAATSALIGTAMGITLWLMGVKQAAMWGVTAGILNSIPYFGTIVVTGALALVAFLQFGTPGMVLAVTGVTLFITSIDGFLLTPLLAGKLSSMNNLAIFLSLLFWGWMWGAMGMLLAIPIMVVVKSICDHIEGLQPIGHLLGEGK